MMPLLRKRIDYTNSEEGRNIRKILQDMTEDASYNTESSYNANAAVYPDHVMSFTDKHIAYLSSHPNLDAKMYIANLKLMTRIK